MSELPDPAGFEGDELLTWSGLATVLEWLPALLDAYKTGTGVPYPAFGVDTREGWHNWGANVNQSLQYIFFNRTPVSLTQYADPFEERLRLLDREANDVRDRLAGDLHAERFRAQPRTAARSPRPQPLR